MHRGRASGPCIGAGLCTLAMATSFNLISPMIIKLYLQKSLKQLLSWHVIIILKIIYSHASGPCIGADLCTQLATATSFNLISPMIIELYLQKSLKQLLYWHIIIVLKIIYSHASGPCIGADLCTQLAMATSFNLISPMIIELYLQKSLKQLLYWHIIIVLKII